MKPTELPIRSIKIPSTRARGLGDVTQLAESIREIGLLNPITVTTKGVLISGWHRLEACRSLGWKNIPAISVTLGAVRTELAEIDENLIRNDLSALERAEHFKKRKCIYLALHPETGHGGDHKSEAFRSSKGNDSQLIPSFADDASAKSSLSARAVRRDVLIAERISQEVRNLIRGTAIADNHVDLYQLAKMKPKDQEAVAKLISKGKAANLHEARSIQLRAARTKHVAELSRGNSPLSSVGAKYPIILCDPPWKYDFSNDDADRIENFYPTMTVDEIASLPINTVAMDDSILFLWAPNPKLVEALHVMKTWGFEYRTNAVWSKGRIGRGYYFRACHEILLVGVRRKGLPTPRPGDRVPSIIEAPRMEHSAKPEEVYRIIERFWPTLPRLEMFSRKSRKGWASWGNQAAPQVAETKATRKPGKEVA